MTHNDLLSEVIALGTRLAHLEGWQKAHDRKHTSIENDIKSIDVSADHSAESLKWLTQELARVQSTLATQGVQTQEIADLVTRISWMVTAGAAALSIVLGAAKRWPWLLE